MSRSMAALTLAVATAAPIVALPPTAAHAVSALNEIDQALLLLADQAKPSDPELLATGMDQYNKGRYEEAAATLQQVKSEGLPEADRSKLTDTLSRVEMALKERRAARAEFELGEAALTEKNPEQAIKHYRAAADNQFADEATKTKATSQLAVAEASMQGVKRNYRQLYRDAVSDYKAGRFDQAKEKFNELQTAGYRGGLFDRKPGEYLRDIDRKTAAMAQEQAKPAEEQPGAQEEKPAVAEVDRDAQRAEREAARRKAKEAYEAGVAAYRRKDYATARTHFEEAQAANYKPGLFKDSPSRYLSMIASREERAAQEMARREASEREAAERSAMAAADQNAKPPAETTPPTKTDEIPVKPVTPPAEVAATAPVAPPEMTELQATARMEKLRQQQRAYEAEQLLKRAADAEKNGRVREAYDLYAEASRLSPDTAEAIRGAERMQALGVGGADQPLIERATAQIQLQKQIVRDSFDRAIEDANTAIARRDFVAAADSVDAARVAKLSRPEIFSADELRGFDTRIADAQLRLDRERSEVVAQAEVRTRTDAQREAELRLRLQEEERRRTVAGLIGSSRQLTRDGNYKEALGVINQIIIIDPTNEYALGVRQLVEDYALIQTQRGMRERFDREFRKTLNATEEMKTPYQDLMNYPTNWPDISETRDREAAQERQGSAEDLQAQAVLERRLPEINLPGIPFAEAMDFLRDITGANIYVNWRSIEAAGVERTVPVTARLRDVRFAKALTTILNDVGGGTVQLAYTIDEGVITISTAEELNRNREINVYDIRDLLVIAPDFDQPPEFNLDSRGGGGGGGGRGGGGGGRGGGGGGGNQNIFGQQQGQNQQTGATNAERTEELVTEITDLIKETVDRESWTDNGGTVGSLKFLSGQLIVTQTPENHRALVGLLDKLRETRAIQVSIEARFLTVTRNFLEDIGVDLDFFFNINDINKFSPISVQQNSQAFTAAPTTQVPGSIGAGAQPAMQIQGSFLDDFQVNFLIRATQASQNSSIVNAPRVTVFNSQRAFIIVAQQQAYVSDLEAITAEGVGLFQPVVDTVPSGVQLLVQPTVSADRKYVTLSLQPQLAQLLDLATFSVGSIATNPGTVPGGGGGTTFGIGNIQLPLLSITAVNTIVSVPDGGTLLLGGQTIVGEVEVEEGVPILSKIPLIKRLFTNKSRAKDEQILLILVKPSIIIQREIENAQFPLLSSRSTVR